MKRRIIVLFLAGLMALSVCSCGNEKSGTQDNFIIVETEAIQEREPSEEGVSDEDQQPSEEMERLSDEDGRSEEEAGSSQAEASQNQADAFSLDDLKKLEFCFSSGAGGWATYMYIEADGSFSGEYFDGDLGVTGEGYPNGTMYQCDFSGRFTQPVQVNEYTYSMQIQELHYAEEVGKEEIKDGMLYCYTDVYGLDGAEDILIYLPGAPLEELPEEFRSWVGYYDLSYTTDTELPFYALNNEARQYGFSSYDMVENLKENLTFMEDWSASIENSLRNDSLTQMELNEKTKELYDLWDSVLNNVWNVLKRIQDEEAMSALIVEEREWIALKEQSVAEAGAEYEGGTMQSMIMNEKAAEMTKARVYELMELLD